MGIIAFLSGDLLAGVLVNLEVGDLVEFTACDPFDALFLPIVVDDPDFVEVEGEMPVEAELKVSDF